MEVQNADTLISDDDQSQNMTKEVPKNVDKIDIISVEMVQKSTSNDPAQNEAQQTTVEEDTETQTDMLHEKSCEAHDEIPFVDDIQEAAMNIETENLNQEVNEPVAYAERQVNSKAVNSQPIGISISATNLASSRTDAAYECDNCDRKFKSKKVLLRHVRRHVRNIHCQIYRKSFASKSSLKMHEKVHQGSTKGAQTFDCDICGKTLKWRANLTSHKRIHNGKFECEVCHAKFTRKYVLNAHKRDYHENPWSYSCKFCKKVFAQKAGLNQHEKTHDRNRPKPFQCKKCDYASHSKQHFENHQRYHQKMEEKFVKINNQIILSQTKSSAHL